MSLLSHLAGAVKGGIVGFVSGGYAGAAVGAVAGYAGNPAKTKNVGIRPGVNQTKGKIQTSPDASPIFIGQTNLPNTSSFSSSPTVRSQVIPGVQKIGYNGQAPIQYADQMMGFNWSPQGPVNSLGFSTSGGRSMASAMSMYRHYYTKKGTPRRTRHDGQPYAIPRMNPMNPRAARRAIRRIRGARKLLQRIERSLPRARTTHHRRAA